MRFLMIFCVLFLQAAPALASDPWTPFAFYVQGEHEQTFRVRCRGGSSYEFKIAFGATGPIVFGRSPIELFSMAYNDAAVPGPIKAAFDKHLSAFGNDNHIKANCGVRQNFGDLPNGAFLLIEISGTRSCFTASQQAAFEAGEDIVSEPINRLIEWHDDSVFAHGPPLEPCVARALSRPPDSITVR